MSIINVWTIRDKESHWLYVPSRELCMCDFCEYDHEAQEKKYFDVYNIMGKVLDNDMGKKVYYNTITKCFSVENDEQKEEREKREQ